MRSPRFLALFLIAAFLFLSHSASADKSISWSLPRISQDVIIGTTSSIEISFITDEALDDLRLEVVPALAPYVFTSPSAFSSVPGGVPQPVSIFISIPQGINHQKLGGTIHLRRGSRTLAPPLHIKINARQATASELPPQLALPSPDRIVTESGLENVDFVKDEINIIFKQGTQETAIINLISQIGGRVLGSIPEINFYQVQVALEGFENLSNLIDQVKQNQIVELAFHHYEFNSFNFPDDPGTDLSYAPDLINLPATWDITTGQKSFVNSSGQEEKIAIGILDTVFASQHADLRDNVTKFDGNTAPLIKNHGTRIASVVGAKGNNASGIAGVMWDASLYLYSDGLYSNPDKFDSTLQILRITQAIRDRVRVLNISQGVSCTRCDDPKQIRAMIEADEVYNYLLSQANQSDPGMLWVVAAGNESTNVQNSTPARLSLESDYVVSVSSVDSQARLSSFSNYGQGITVAAPGKEIHSLTRDGSFNDGTITIAGIKIDTGDSTGTSLSAPYVTGVAGLVLSVNPTIDAARLKQIIHDTADETGEFDPEGNPVRLLNAFRAVQQASITSCNSFLTFINGNAGIPGDGLIVNANTVVNPVNPFFELSNPIPVRDMMGGFTATVFPADGRPVAQIIFGVTNLQNSGPCRVRFTQGPLLNGRVDFNGLEGAFVNVTPATFEFWLRGANFFAPGCGITLNDLYVDRILVTTTAGPPFFLTTLDAAAICPGQNNVSGTVIP